MGVTDPLTHSTTEWTLVYFTDVTLTGDELMIPTEDFTAKVIA